MTADMNSNKSWVLLLLNCFWEEQNLAFSNFKIPKFVRLNSTHYFILQIPNKRKHQQIALSHLPDIEFKRFHEALLGLY